MAWIVKFLLDVFAEPLLFICFPTIKLHGPKEFYNFNEFYALNILFSAVHTTSQSTNTAFNKFGKRYKNSEYIL